MKHHEVGKFTAYYLREYLRKLLRKLDELDGEDFFGTEGWRRRLMEEDE